MRAGGNKLGRARVRAVDIDRHVAVRLREQRLLLGLSQADLADRLGVSYQQIHKYETGLNRLAAGRLHTLAEALGVETASFFPDQERQQPNQTAELQRQLLGLMRNFAAIPDLRQQKVISELAQTLANNENKRPSELLALGWSAPVSDEPPLKHSTGAG